MSLQEGREEARAVSLTFNASWQIGEKEGGPSLRGAAFFACGGYFGVNEVPQPQLFCTLGFRYFQPPSSRLAVL